VAPSDRSHERASSALVAGAGAAGACRPRAGWGPVLQHLRRWPRAPPDDGASSRAAHGGQRSSDERSLRRRL